MTNRDVALMYRGKSLFQNLKKYLEEQNTKTKVPFDGSIIKSVKQKLSAMEYFQSDNESFESIQQDNINQIVKHLPNKCQVKDLIIELPALAYGGSPLNPNPANLAVIGKSIFYPEQFNTQIGESIESSLQVSGKKIESMNTFFFHSGKGNVHCLSNGLRLCKP